jgi:hypothetical protein
MNYKVIQVETEGDIGVFADRLDRSTWREAPPIVRRA